MNESPSAGAISFGATATTRRAFLRRAAHRSGRRFDRVILSNRRIGIALRKQLSDGQGPIAGLRLNSGAWVGDSRREGDAVLVNYAVEVVARGPVYLEVVCRATLAQETTWTLRVRVLAHEPVILVDESFDLVGATATFIVDLEPQFSPDTLLYRMGRQPHHATTSPIAPGEVYVLDPWLHWWEGERQGHGFSLFRKADAGQDAQGDVLSIASRFASNWVDLAIPPAQRAPARITLNKGPKTLTMAFALKRGARKWMVMALDARDCLKPLQGQPSTAEITVPDEFMIKHGQFPLNVVKQYVVRWPNDTITYPRLFVTKEKLPALRANLPRPERYTERVADFRQGTFSQFSLDGAITPTAVYFATGDEGVVENIARNAVPMIQTAVNAYLKQPELPLGVAPHLQQPVATYLAMADAGLAYDKLAADVRRRLLAQIAFLGYVFDNPSYWSPARDFRANPNMTTAVNGYKLMVACLVPNHPKGRDWAADALLELRRQIREWSDDNGGWIEAPHYAAVGFDQLLAGLVMAHNAGLDDGLDLPRVKKIAEWFGKISTPPDSRLGGFRHLPPIGNTYLNEPTGLFGTLATLWRERDPGFAAQMQWLFEQHRSWPEAGIGGGYPGMIGCHGLFRGSTIPPQAPAWESELFPKTGAVLRNAFPSKRERQLYLIAGDHRDHYDDDAGSITLWGRGRVMADDFGYESRAPQEDHRLLIAPGVGGTMTINTWSPSPRLAYLRGVKGPWTRQIMFVKGPNPDSPAYFVLRDSLAKPSQFTWLLWLTARDVVLGQFETDLNRLAAASTAPLLDDGTAMSPPLSPHEVRGRPGCRGARGQSRLEDQVG